MIASPPPGMLRLLGLTPEFMRVLSGPLGTFIWKTASLFSLFLWHWSIRRTHLLVFLHLGQPSSTAFSEVGDLQVFLSIFFQVRCMVMDISDVCLHLFSQHIFGTSIQCNCTIIDALFSFSTGKPRWKRQRSCTHLGQGVKTGAGMTTIQMRRV